MQFLNWVIRLGDQRLLHLSRVLRQPRNFKTRATNRLPRAPIDGLDRAQIKKNVSSLYASSWDAVYERNNPSESHLEFEDKSKFGNELIEVSLKDVMKFLQKLSSGPIDSFGTSEHGMIIAEVESGKGRQNIGDSLIRKVRGIGICLWITFLLHSSNICLRITR